MDVVSGLADKSNDFAIFLTVTRKFGYICLYIFHIIYPTESIWQMILSQTKIFKVLPSTIQLGNKLKILIGNYDRETISYIPARDLWINWLYMPLSNKSKHTCLAIDCRKPGPAKYRTSAESNFEQFFYFVQNKKDRLFNKCLAKKDLQSKNPLDFKIDSVISVAKNGQAKIFKAVQKLKNLAKQNDGNNGGNCGKKLQTNLNTLIENTLEEEKKNGGRPRFLH